MAPREALRALAERAGILAGYTAVGGAWRETDDAAREALLGAMGYEVSTEAAARRSLAAEEDARRAAWIDPVQVIEAGGRLRLPLQLEPQLARQARFALSAAREGGAERELSLRLGAARGSPVLSAPSANLETGEHTLVLRAALPGGTRELRQTCIVTPRRAVAPDECLGGRRAFGLWANLYSLRSEHALPAGIGDLACLRGLVELAGEAGAAFVGLSPLHAVRNRGGEISPYGPVTRLFRNPLYLDLAAIPEWSECPEARPAPALRALEALDRSPRIDHARVAEARRTVLECLHHSFRRRHGDADGERARSYRGFLARRGGLLADFATFQALEDHLAGRGLPRDWQAWPRELRDPRSAAVARFREAHPEAVDFHAWCQFELDRQLAGVADGARRAGLGIGLYSDLAVGSLRSGFDAWAFPGLFAPGIHLGAPPDDYSAAGQDWGFPPLVPGRLREDAYRYFRLLLEAGFEHAGALRIDHALGLRRQYWIPAGRPAGAGAYVRFPTRDLLRLIALASHRHGALVVGEDLGTVPPGFVATLARHGVLSTRVLLFERDGRGRFRPARAYSRRALVTAHTHDHPPLAGYCAGRDLELRRRAGEIASDRALEVALRRRDAEVSALRRRLAGGGAPPADAAALCRAAYRFLAGTPAPLLGVSVDDLAGETEPVNLPGLSAERFPSWSRRLREPLERLPESAAARGILDAVASRRLRPS